MRDEILRLEHIYLRHKGVTVLEDFRFNIFKGEFVILYGNFGSGRKEIAQLLAGEIELTSGSIYIQEERRNQKEAFIPARTGIFVFSDHTGLIPSFSVAENIFLSWKKNLFSFSLPQKKIYKETTRILAEIGVDILPQKLVSEISSIDQQLVKLAKAYCRKVSLIVMNDMADIYTEAEREKLFHALKILQNKGVAILWITGKCMNAIQYMDRMIVIRQGRNVRTFFDTPEDKEVLNRLVNETSHTRKPDWIRDKKNTELFRIEEKTLEQKEEILIQKGECIGIVFEEAKELEHFSNILLGKQPSNCIKMWMEYIEYAPTSYQKAVNKGVCEIDMIDMQNNLFHNLTVKENLMMNTMKKTSKGGIFINKTYMEFVYAKFNDKYLFNRENNIHYCSWKQRENIIFHRLSMCNSKLIVATEFWAQVDDQRWDGMVDNIQCILEQNKSFLFLSVNESDLKPVCNRVYYRRGK
jgi:ribose transport system ATP-binding protein